MTDDLALRVFFDIHRDLAQEAPGGAEHTLRALSMVKGEPKKVMDIGCGPGAQSLVLAKALDGQVVSVDLHRQYLDSLMTRAQSEGCADRIDVVQADMGVLPFSEGSFDLLWSEGAIYNIGFEAGLKAWRPLLRDSGHVVLTEAVWLKDDVPEECLSFWNEGYPAMTDVQANLQIARDCGFQPLDSFVLPESAWWAYYEPIEERLAQLEEKYADRPEALEVLSAERCEIELYRRYSSCYGYAFIVLKCA